MSLTLGKLLIVTGLSKSNVDAKIGRAAFLLPEIKTSPLILHGPLIKNLSIFKLWEVLHLFGPYTYHFYLRKLLLVPHSLLKI